VIKPVYRALSMHLWCAQVNRRSLPRHEFSASAAFVAPANPVEEAVAAAWQHVLGMPEDTQLSVEANWFEVGLVCFVLNDVLLRSSELWRSLLTTFLR
jgi:hypothetical protein